jgi:hypothetical protein
MIARLLLIAGLVVSAGAMAPLAPATAVEPQKVVLVFSGDRTQYAEELLFLKLKFDSVAAGGYNNWRLLIDEFDPKTGKTNPTDPKAEFYHPAGFSPPGTMDKKARAALPLVEIYMKTGRPHEVFCRVGEGSVLLPFVGDASTKTRIPVSEKWKKYYQRIPQSADYPLGAVKITVPAIKEEHKQDRLELLLKYDDTNSRMRELGTDFTPSIEAEAAKKRN